MKKCKSCLTEKGFEEFNLAEERKDRMQAFCRDCQSRVAKEFYQRRKQKVIKKTQKWREDNPEFKLMESVNRMIIRLLKDGGDKRHKVLKMTPSELRSKIPQPVEDYGKTWKLVFSGIHEKYYKRGDYNTIIASAKIRLLPQKAVQGQQ